MRKRVSRLNLLVVMLSGLLLLACASQGPEADHKEPAEKAAKSVDDMRSRPDQNAPGSQILEDHSR